MLLSKCCCCCSLKYGYFAYAILSMAARLMACVSLYHASQIYFVPSNSTTHNSRFSTVLNMWLSYIMNIYSGWVVTSAVSLFFTMKGIVQKRSILIYPYIVVLVVELTGLIMSVTFFAIVATTYYLIILPFAALILGYELWCLISLYKQIKHNERIRYIPDTVPLKAI